MKIDNSTRNFTAFQLRKSSNYSNYSQVRPTDVPMAIALSKPSWSVAKKCHSSNNQQISQIQSNDKNYETGYYRSLVYENMKKMLHLCGQVKTLTFDEMFKSQLDNIKYISEGTYGKVYRIKTEEYERPMIYKFVPLNVFKTNRSVHTVKLDLALKELKMSLHLNTLINNEENSCDSFVTLENASLVRGYLPSKFRKADYERLSEAEKFSHKEKTECCMYYLIYTMEDRGLPLYCYPDLSTQEFNSVIAQLYFALKVAEFVCEFEHRDLYDRNILLQRTEESHKVFRIKGKEVKIPTFGVNVTIIDFSLSRMTIGNEIVYEDLTYFVPKSDLYVDSWEAFHPWNNNSFLYILLEKRKDNVGNVQIKKDDCFNYNYRDILGENMPCNCGFCEG